MNNMRLLRSSLAASLLVAMSGAGAAFAGDVDNPQFSAWSKYKVGSRVVLESKMDGGMTMESTRTLKEKAADHVVVVCETVLEMGGHQEPSRPIEQKVMAKLDDGKVKEIGHEQVKVLGKSYDCTVYATEDVAPNYIGTNPKLWITPDVPGGVVRVDMSTPKGVISQLLKDTKPKN
jgi:hypothetical protein